jgi:hypothetical protein
MVAHWGNAEKPGAKSLKEWKTIDCSEKISYLEISLSYLLPRVLIKVKTLTIPWNGYV